LAAGERHARMGLACRYRYRNAGGDWAASDRGDGFCVPMLRQVSGARVCAADAAALRIRGRRRDIGPRARPRRQQSRRGWRKLPGCSTRAGTLVYSEFHHEAGEGRPTRSFKDRRHDDTVRFRHRCYDTGGFFSAEPPPRPSSPYDIIQRGGWALECAVIPKTEEFLRRWEGLRSCGGRAESDSKCVPSSPRITLINAQSNYGDLPGAHFGCANRALVEDPHPWRFDRRTRGDRVMPGPPQRAMTI